MGAGVLLPGAAPAHMPIRMPSPLSPPSGGVGVRISAKGQGAPAFNHLLVVADAASSDDDAVVCGDLFIAVSVAHNYAGHGIAVFDELLSFGIEHERCAVGLCVVFAHVNERR